MNKLIVSDADHPAWHNNQCFDPAKQDMGFGLALYVRLAQEARRRGIDVATVDVYRALARAPERVACLTVQYTAETQALLAGGARPSICHSFESPVVADKFCHFLARYAGRFEHNFQFRGMGARLAGTGTTFHPAYFPIDTRTRLPLRAWAQRDDLVMIIGNAWARTARPTRLAEWRARLKVAVRQRVWRLTDPWLRVPRLYRERLRAIEYFSRRGGFRLYGHGWDQPAAGLSAAQQAAARQAYGGAIAPGALAKRALLNGYRFAICFENCVFPGYVTEKLFDCWLAGCVPIYWGAPDIAEFVPEQTFIDYRRFGSMAALDRYLSQLSPAEAQQYLDAAGDFLASTGWERFDARRLALEMTDILEEALR